jgi:hypothetical protein
VIERWLTPEQTAQRLGTQVHKLPTLVKKGKLPSPSYHLGPRSPRYDLTTLDSLMTQGHHNPRASLATLADEIRAKAGL